MTMWLVHALRLSDSPCIAFVGAGGKTTALFQVARELSPPVVVTATTHLHVDQIRLADSHWSGKTPEDFIGLEDNLSGVVLVTGPQEEERTTGLNDPCISWLRAVRKDHSMPLLVEADGSRRHALKAPAEQEPSIPAFVESVIVVAGLSGLGKPLTKEYVHRPEIFARLSGLTPGRTITTTALARLLTHPNGGLKNIPLNAHRVALLNQADTPELQSQAKVLAEELLSHYQSVVVASLDPLQTNQQPAVYAVHEPTAGIVLAAGESSRFGSPKQLLDYHGQPFVQAVARAALSAGLSPVVVVSGANAEEVEAAANILPVTIVRNNQWQAGQSSSIRAGLGKIPPETGSAIFLLADQPQVTPTVLRALVERHSTDLATIVAPQVAGQRANPVLFDRRTFPDLISLSGDVGGRVLFSKYPVTYLPWNDEQLLSDIDFPQDYRRLANEE